MDPSSQEHPRNRLREKIPQDVLEWARGQYSDEEILEGIREIEETGGLPLSEFIDELKAIARDNG